ncbi:MAG: hypothetical protein Phog2KO_39300 [Phototrophicaceae bacterium]
MRTAKIQGDLWSTAATDWAELQEKYHIPLFNAMLDATNVGENTTLLDVGCGGGTSSQLASKRGAIVTGLDAADGLIEIAKTRTPSAEFHTGDMESLSFEDNTFDVVFAANSLQYAGDRVNALREFMRVCHPEGLIAVGLFGQAEDVDYKIVFRAVANALPEPPAGKGPFGLSDRDLLHNLFAEAGLSIAHHDEVNCPMHFPDVNTFWRATRSGGPVTSIIRQIGEEKVKQSVLNAVNLLQNDSDEVIIKKNHYQYLIAKNS